MEENHIEFIDISGTIENFQNLYMKTDLHIGYRVHAHIFSMSINKPSVLICEDGRGTSLKETVSGLYFNAFDKFKGSFFSKILNRLFKYDQYVTNKLLCQLIINELEEEVKNNYPRISQYRKDIDGFKKNMIQFLVRELG